MRLWPRFTFALAGLLATAASVAAAPLRVLFLGNSLTAGNDVPALVQAMARLQGVDLHYLSVTPGGYALEDHWHDGRHTLLASGNYDVLVLQQGPSTLASSQANLREWAVTWAAHARRFGTRPALYMIWPVRTQANGFALVSQSYRNAALAADAGIFPAGEAWQQALRLNPSLALYQSDDLHALPAGSFLAAMVIARGLVSLDPSQVPASVNGISVPAATLATFRSIVETMPASTLGALETPVAPDPPGTGEPTVAPPGPAAAPGPTATPPTGGGSGRGGGAPSAWFFLALFAAGAARWLGARRPVPRSP